MGHRRLTEAAPRETRCCQSCASIKAPHGLDATLTPVSGGRYELWCGETLILERAWLSVPSEEAMLAALRAHLDVDRHSG